MAEIGIYCIKNLLDNKKYIGQSIDITKRKNSHFNNLRRNKHYSTHLQSAWNKYGEDNFKFTIIECCNKSELDDKEKYYINKYNTTDGKYGYNSREGGRDTTYNSGTLIKMSMVQKESYRNTDRRILLSKSKASISLDTIKKIKIMLYMDMDMDEILNITNVSYDKVMHIDCGQTFNYILPKLNYYIKNRYTINKKKKSSEILRLYRNGTSYQLIADIIHLDKRNIQRIINKNKTTFDELMRKNCNNFYNEHRNKMIVRMHKNGWNKKKISIYYRISRDTVYNVLKTVGIA